MPALEPFARTLCLETLFSTSSNVHISLLSTLPVAGVGEVEISPAGYARQPAVNWSTVALDADESTVRQCTDTIAFGPYATDEGTIGWAAYDALVAGNLLCSGVYLAIGSNAFITITIPTGDDIQFQPGNLRIGITSDSGACLIGGSWGLPWGSPWG